LLQPVKHFCALSVRFWLVLSSFAPCVCAVFGPFALTLRTRKARVEPQGDALVLIEACSFVAASLPGI
jgi:hypothetical protein